MILRNNDIAFDLQAFFLTNIFINPEENNTDSTETSTINNSDNKNQEKMSTKFASRTIPVVDTSSSSSTIGDQDIPVVDFLSSTPPSITRVLTYASPFIHLFSYFLSLITWSTDNPSESCLLVAA